MKEKHYVALIDADTIIYSSAACIQKSPILVKHKLSGRTKQFDNITALRTWLKEDKRGQHYREDDFEWEQQPELVEPVSHACQIIKKKIDGILELPWCKDIKIFVGGEGNFRKDIYPAYKANRGAKPLAFQDCYNFVTKKWKDKVVVCDGWEAEDHAVAEAFAGYERARKAKDKDASGVVLCAVDKDVNMCPGYRYNYQKPEEGVVWIDSLTAYKAFCKQLLTGDRSTDNILGVDKVTPEMKAEFGIRTKSIGDKTAWSILEGLSSEKELFEQVIKVYKMAYEDLWEQQLDLTGKLVWITRKREEAFDLDKETRRLKIS